MYYLAYLSQATRELDDEELAAILTKARASNEKLGVTGCCCYAADCSSRSLKARKMQSIRCITGFVRTAATATNGSSPAVTAVAGCLPIGRWASKISPTGTPKPWKASSTPPLSVTVPNGPCNYCRSSERDPSKAPNFNLIESFN